MSRISTRNTCGQLCANQVLSATPTTQSSSLPDYFVTDDGHFAGKMVTLPSQHI